MFNGLLLAPHLDALFDGGWITFMPSGWIAVDALLPPFARESLGVESDFRVQELKPEHAQYLEFHHQ